MMKINKLAVLLCIISIILANANNKSEENNIKVQQNTQNYTKIYAETNIQKNGPFLGALLAAIFSEFGDKTFLIAAIMATRYSRLSVFIGSTAALVLMSLISCVLGQFVQGLLSPKYTSILAGILLAVFGLLLLWEAYKNEDNEEEEEELNKELEAIQRKVSIRSQKSDQKSNQKNNQNEPLLNDVELTPMGEQPQQAKEENTNTIQEQEQKVKGFLDKQNLIIMGIVFSQVFFGEWGDKSQFTTVALAADNNAYLVFFGSSLGLAFCNLFAVLGGKLLAEKVSERILNICGGILMLLFALSSFYRAFNQGQEESGEVIAAE